MSIYQGYDNVERTVLDARGFRLDSCPVTSATLALPRL